jgi:ribosomal protein S3
VKVTCSPAQIVVALAEIETDAGRLGLTVIVMAFEVAGEPVKQGDALEVNTQVTISPLFRDVELKLDELVPTFAPFTFH